MSFAAVGAVGGLVSAGAGLYGALNQPSGGDMLSQSLAFSQQPRLTPYSGVNKVPGAATLTPGYTYIDPSIRKLREEALTRLPGYRTTLGNAFGTYDTTVGGLQNQLLANNNPYMQAMVDPLKQQAAIGRANLTQDFARRGIFGDLYTNALANYDTTTGREIANQGALATRNNINSLLGVSGARYSGATDYVNQLRGLDAVQQSVAAANLQQELSSLGLATPDMSAVLGAAGFTNGVNQQNNAMFGRSLYGLGNAIGGLGNVDWGSFNGSSAPSNFGYSGITGLSTLY